MLNYKKNKKTACWMIAVEGIICIISIILIVCFFTNAMKREEPSTSAVQAGNEDSGKMMQHTIENLENNGTDTAALDLSGSWILDESYTVQSNNGIELQAIIGSSPTNSPSTLLLKPDGVIEFTLGGYKGEGRWQPDGDTGRYVADVLLSNDGGNVSLPLYDFRESPDSTLYLVLHYGDAVLFWSKMNQKSDIDTLNLIGSWILDESYTVQSNNGIELQAIIGKSPTNSPSTLLLKPDGVIEFTLGGYKGEGRWQPDGDTGRYVADVLLSNDGGNVSLPLYTFRESPNSTLYLVLDYGDAVLFWSKMNQKSDIDTLKWNKMWELWVEGQADSPYAELMTYQSEINNGGHNQYFTNVENTGDLQKEMMTLETVLPLRFKENLKKAYEAYLILEDKGEDEQAEETLEQCDDVFYKNEAELNHILKAYADKVKL